MNWRVDILIQKSEEKKLERSDIRVGFCFAWPDLHSHDATVDPFVSFCNNRAFTATEEDENSQMTRGARH